MNKHLLKISGLATLVLLLQVPGFAQKARSGRDKDTLSNRLNEYDEIIIKRKDNKDAKVTIEIKDGQVLVDGKPVSEYDNDKLSVRRKKVRVMDGSTFSFSGPDGLESFTMPEMPEMPEGPEGPKVRIMPPPYRNGSGWNYEGGDMLKTMTNRALLGVTSKRTESEEEGAKITEIAKGSAAEKAGLKTGDLITRLDEIKIDGPEALSEAVHKYKPEDKVTVTFKREGKEQKVTAVLGKSKTAQSYNLFQSPGARNFNFDYKGMEAPYLNRYGGQPRLGIKAQDTEEGKGVKVLDVDDESVADKAGIKEGDIITRFDGTEVNSATQLSELARASKDKATFKVSVLRDGKPQELEVKIPKKLKTADL